MPRAWSKWHPKPQDWHFTDYQATSKWSFSNQQKPKVVSLSILQVTCFWTIKDNFFPLFKGKLDTIKSWIYLYSEGSTVSWTVYGDRGWLHCKHAAHSCVVDCKERGCFLAFFCLKSEKQHYHWKRLFKARLYVNTVEEVSKKKIPIIYNIFFYDTSSTSVIKEEGPV